MKWAPKYATAEQILEEAGYIHIARGWQYPLKDKRGVQRRLHAFPMYGYIEVHKDENYLGKGRHKSVSTCGSTIEALRIFKEIDMRYAPPLKLSWYDRLRAFLKI